jgi:peptide/nickel transport system permease protein
MSASATNAPAASLKGTRLGQSLWRRAGRYLLGDRLTLAAGFGLIVLTLACLLGPPIVEQALHVDVNDTSVADRYQPPSAEHVLGTDELGRDQFIRLLYGGRVSLSIAYFASLLSITMGVLLGTVAAFSSSRVDDILLWFINTLDSIPAIFLLIIISTIWSPTPITFIVVLAFFSWTPTCRLVRGEVLLARERDYILAGRALGAPASRLILQHILPNILSTIIVALTINAGLLILTESGLSFLGLGVQAPTPTWGNMLNNARSFFVRAPHLVVWPGALITLTVLFFFLLGDGLRDALDPRTVRK